MVLNSKKQNSWISRLYVACVVIALASLVPYTLSAKNEPWFKNRLVRKGESLSLIAKQTYRKPWKYVYIVAANQITDQTKVDPGTKLRLPDVLIHQVTKGETFAKIAQMYLSKAQFANLIIWANQVSANSVPKEGVQIIIPHILKHPIRAGQTLEDIAELYYQDRAMVANLKLWNKLNLTNPTTGIRTIWLPIREGILTTMASYKGRPATIENVIAASTKKPVIVSATATPIPVQTAVPTLTPTPTSTATSTPTAIPTPDRQMQESHQVLDITSMPLVKQQIREARYKQALELMSKLNTESFKTSSQQADFHWQALLCYVAVGNQKNALKSLKDYLQTGEENLTSLKSRSEELSPKLRWLLEQYEKNKS
jgi:LysM repeat protein